MNISLDDIAFESVRYRPTAAEALMSLLLHVAVLWWQLWERWLALSAR